MLTNIMTYTDKQLKQALAKMLPKKVFWRDNMVLSASPHDGRLDYRDTELLHLCWLVEETLAPNQISDCVCTVSQIHSKNGNKYVTFNSALLHASWQQRTIALAKTLGVEIV